MAPKGRIGGRSDRGEDDSEGTDGRVEAWGEDGRLDGGTDGWEKEGGVGGRGRSRSLGRAGAERYKDNDQVGWRGRGKLEEDGGPKDEALKRLSSKQDEWLASCIEMISGLVNSESPPKVGGQVGGDAGDDHDGGVQLEEDDYDGAGAGELGPGRGDVSGGDSRMAAGGRGLGLKYRVDNRIGSPNSSSTAAHLAGQVGPPTSDLIRLPVQRKGW